MIYSKDTFHLSPLPPGGIFSTSDGPGISSLRSNEVIVTTTNLAKCLNLVIMKVQGSKLSSWQVLTWWQNERILIQLEHHFLHPYVDILFATYKNGFNQSSFNRVEIKLFNSITDKLQRQLKYQVKTFGRFFSFLKMLCAEFIGYKSY